MVESIVRDHVADLVKAKILFHGMRRIEHFAFTRDDEQEAAQRLKIQHKQTFLSGGRNVGGLLKSLLFGSYNSSYSIVVEIRLPTVFSAHLTLLERAIAVDVCLSVRPSVRLSVRQTRIP